MSGKQATANRAAGAGREQGKVRGAAQAKAQQREEARTVLEPSLWRAGLDGTYTNPATVVTLQQAAGNRAVSRLVQAKLMVGPTGDRYEQEADRIAGQVSRMPEPVAQRETGDDDEIQAQPLANALTPLVQRGGTQSGSFAVGAEFEQRLAASRGGGQPLPAHVRSFMEPRFGVDFGGVRLHTDGEAAQLNREIGARAFTNGRDIYLGEGRNDVQSGEGTRLLAHELTHVVQQSCSAPSRTAQRRISFELEDAPEVCVPTSLKNLSEDEMRVLAWLRSHQPKIVAAEQRYGIDRRAIAGAIAWEGLENVKFSFQSLRAVGPGKVHYKDNYLFGEGNPLSKQVEDAGYLPRQTMARRKKILQTPAGAIVYIAAAMAGGADIAVQHGYYIRCNPGMLTQFYNSKDLPAWKSHLAAKPRGAPLVPGTAMALWTEKHNAFLEDAVGQPQLPQSDLWAPGVQGAASPTSSQPPAASGVDQGRAPASPGSSSEKRPETATKSASTSATKEDLRKPIQDKKITPTKWKGTPEQMAFLERVLNAHIALSSKGGKRKALPDLSGAELKPVPGTSIRMATAAAEAAGELLAAAKAELGTAKQAGDTDALKTRYLSATSGYRNRSHQETLYRSYFTRAKNGYYNDTAAKRAKLSGGEHGDLAVEHMVKYIRPKIAAPGFSNHQAGLAIDLRQIRTKGNAIKNSTNSKAVKKWRDTWFFKWLQANAATYRFGEYKREPWHWTYS